MRIGVAGGTGGMGRGFAVRWCRSHDVVIGSRDAGRAEEAAAGYERAAREAYGAISGSVAGAGNASLAEGCDALVLSIPYGNIDAVCPEVLRGAGGGCAVISPIVPMERTEAGFEYLPARDGVPAAHEAVARHVARREDLVSAFHVISEKKLADPLRELDYDVFVCGDGEAAVGTACGLARDIPGLRPVTLGPGRLAYMAEMATPLLLNAMVRNGIRNPGIKVV